MFAVYTRTKNPKNISRLQNKFIRVRENGKPVGFNTLEEVKEYIKTIPSNYEYKINVVKK